MEKELKAQEFRPCTEEEADEISLSIYDWPDGRSLTQSKSFRLGPDHVLILAELNQRNTWDDEGFDAAEARLTAALRPQPASDSELVEAIAALIAAIDELPVEEMIEQDPRDGTLTLLGYCMQAQGEWDNARRATERLKTTLPLIQSPDAAYEKAAQVAEGPYPDNSMYHEDSPFYGMDLNPDRSEFGRGKEAGRKEAAADATVADIDGPLEKGPAEQKLDSIRDAVNGATSLKEVDDADKEWVKHMAVYSDEVQAELNKLIANKRTAIRENG